MSETLCRATTCYMQSQPERGIAYDFWLRVKSKQAEREWTDVELEDRSGISRSTIDRLAKGKRAPQTRVVHALADALGIDREEARYLAKVTPGAPKPASVPEISVREAIMRDPNYDDQQRKIMLDLVDLIDQAAGRSPGPR